MQYSATDRNVPDVTGKILIAGAGAVGLTLGIALARAGRQVVIVEGGPRTPDPDQNGANAGPLPGRPYPGLIAGRMKALGGTTLLWGGQLVPFTARDLSAKAPDGSAMWPIAYDELARWIDAAYDMLGVPEAARDTQEVWRRLSGRDHNLGHGVSVGMNIWLKEADFTRLFAREIDALPGLTIVTDCRLRRVLFAPGSDRAEAELVLPGGEIRRVAPGQIVLANGTIEVSGILLRSAAAGDSCPFAGNTHLGRWYFDHLHGLIGKVEPLSASQLGDLFDNVYFQGLKFGVKIRPGDGAVDGAHVVATLNPALQPGMLIADMRTMLRRLVRGGGNVTETVQRGVVLARVLVPAAWRYVKRRRSTSLFDSGISLGVEAEMRPTPECRVVLDPAVPAEDARAGVHWAIPADLVHDIAAFGERVQTAFAEQGLGTITLDPAVAARAPEVLDRLGDAAHHMGGARMAWSSDGGVVDADQRVFGTGNLHVAGAAVFPSGSFANPTLTAIALGLRLADRLARTEELTRMGPQGSITERLVFGCGRLAGGITERSSAQILQQAAAGGVTTVDCAASYGLGLAEKVVGRAQRASSGGFTVIEKLGGTRDSKALLKSVARYAKRRLRPPRPRSLAGYTPMQAPQTYREGGLSAADLRASYRIASQRIGKIDMLLLHDCGPAEYTPEIAATLAELGTEAGARIGYANTAIFDAATDAAFPSGCIAECAIVPGWLTGASQPPARDGLILHSIMPTGEYLARTDAVFAAGWDRAARLVPGADLPTARIVALYVLAAERVPLAKLIFSSTEPGRLQRLLDGFAAVDEAGLAGQIAGAFAAGPAG